ncbi:MULTISPECIES: GGDEF domain-containing protein [Cryobacterium]|uniref:GGDEF domain-containing protein n=1 Tax=Cryobacterium breve TaxID=1259258 RepID=A0ABY2IXK7_9MICO|nr:MULTISPECIES: GGDEF domain-containing protein [Cryobacterium]TFC93626.1 GGDEF domain-containing protein [Cryobacterium sp. TmT3-12]TFC95320.1 GGDEF domain-containing protein [Cryobacterium breve]
MESILEPAIDVLLAECEQSSANGRHLDGVGQAEAVLARPGATKRQQAHARELLALHRLRLGDYEASVQQGLLALEYLDGSGDLIRQSTVNCTLVLAYSDTGLYEQALRHVLVALETARVSGSALAEFWALSRSSMVHEGMGESERALELGQQALAMSRTIDDPAARFVGLNNLGDTSLTQAQTLRARGVDAGPLLKQALLLVREAVSVAHAQGHSFYESIARTNLVSILIELGEHAEAREQASRARRLAKAHGFRSLEENNDAQLAEVARAEGRLDDATEMMNAQLLVAALGDDPALHILLHRSLYEMNKEAGRFEQALLHHEKLHALMLKRTTDTAGIQSQMLINTLGIEQARHEAERSQRDAERLRSRAAELDLQANTDPLTRLPNRRALDRELPPLMGLSRDRRQPLCVAMIDMDHFKRVNDDHGHATGDQVLNAMASLLRAVTRERDMAVRVGGEEFLLVFADTTLEQAELVCGRLLASVRDYHWGALAPRLACTVSVGVAELMPGETVVGWLARADAALYAAKDAGRDQLATAAVA